MGRRVFEPMDYDKAQERFCDMDTSPRARRRRKLIDRGRGYEIAGNTLLCLDEHSPAGEPWYFVRFFDVDILTWFPDGVVKLNPEGMFHATLMERLDRYCPFDVRRHGGVIFAEGFGVWRRGTDPHAQAEGTKKLKEWADKRPYYSFPAAEFDTDGWHSVYTSNVVGLLNAIWADDAWDRCPMLADALEETGVGHPSYALLRDPKYHDGPNDFVGNLLKYHVPPEQCPIIFARKEATYT